MKSNNHLTQTPNSAMANTQTTAITEPISGTITRTIAGPGAEAIIWALVSVLLVSSAQLIMKWGMMTLTLQSPELLQLWQQQHILPLFNLIIWPFIAVISGLTCYALSMAFWVLALKHLPLSVAYPLLSLSYILVYLGAVFLPWINESFSSTKLIGISSILIGLFFMTQKKS
ncbi:4-amino-4-deoxy-L-arabinose-phosphoundecaprenol flippase subunit ArnF [Shewanella surugensis]|uniref:Probable 4-amino-4-deoxy-L-arabinose-phosphoundecaprenol flippase subunit ArnF n=1 Tax=Shewanella surugensis TaxID=212020 RepID=A0ABT0LHI8_9GAMM|nr:4-amino-4-deoxy-L-arabinose-phosphoundecaprenol flippase subunit ArnF [Shewanella surugensis]MCL1126930.1 4-amino-4-deoxy-L-arabinose-phospho-UDP flippase [Shewanella surugensis]